jgi:hypothetical protein
MNVIKLTKMKNWKTYCFLCLAASYLLAINSCKPTNNIDEGPALPPQESMTMNFDFLNQKKSAFGTDTTLPYHTRAVLAISYWSNIAGVQMVVPVAAFKAALNQTPVLADSIWIWEYDVTSGNGTFMAKLKGQVKGDSVQWKMYLSKVDAAPSINNFLWFEGKSYIGRTGGWWVIYYPMSVSSAIVSEASLLIRWSITSDNEKWLQYTYVADKVWGTTSYIDNVNKGGYIKYGLQGNSIYDAYYDMYSQAEENLVEILWNRSNRSGQINLNSSTVGCWDTNLADKATCD